MLVLVELGRRTGVLHAISTRAWRAGELAAAASVQERYLLEWLCAMAAFGLIERERDGDDSDRWSATAELRELLTEEGEETLAPAATTVVGAANQAVRLAEPFRNGGGLSYMQRDPTLSAAFEQDARINYARGLVDRIIPTVPGLGDRLRRGAAVADLGCGAARGLELMARAFPRAHFAGFDSDERLIHAGRERLALSGLSNVELYTRAIEELSASPMFDVVCAFEVIHNLPDPLAALTRAREILRGGGMFFMYETNASSQRAQDIQLPWAGPLYTMSLLSCLTVSLAHDGAGYGAMWGVQTAERLMGAAGFHDVGHREVIGDAMHVVIWGRA